MANTHPVKILVPNGQIDIIQGWVDQGLFASVTAFCTSAVEKQIEAQTRLIAQRSEVSEGEKTATAQSVKSTS